MKLGCLALDAHLRAEIWRRYTLTVTFALPLRLFGLSDPLLAYLAIQMRLSWGPLSPWRKLCFRKHSNTAQ